MIASLSLLSASCLSVPTQMNKANMTSVIAGLEARARKNGMNHPARLAHYISQLSHESCDFRYDREIWGPTPAQKRYDTRTDLGNTPALDGDGALFSGRTAGQITGHANYRKFLDWCRVQFSNVPDFERYPDLLNTDPWEGLGPIWFWETHALNAAADTGSVRVVTRIINGGYNGLEDRTVRYVRTALAMLGFAPTDIRGYQSSRGLLVDGDAGRITQARLHVDLARLPPII